MLRAIVYNHVDGSLPKLPELVGELTVPTYTFVNGKFQLEDKDQVKQRLGRSPAQPTRSR